MATDLSHFDGPGLHTPKLKISNAETVEKFH